MQTPKTMVWLFVLVGSLYANSLRAEEYILVKKEKYAALYERWINRTDGERVREIRGVFTARTNMASVLALLKNQSAGVHWNKNASAYKVLVTGRDSWINYIQYDLPFPMDDQDCCVMYRAQPLTPGMPRCEITFESTTVAAFPVPADTKRITGIQGKWILEQQANQTIKITYQIATDRNRKIPRWMSDPIVHDNVFRMMDSFQSLLEKNNDE